MTSRRWVILAGTVTLILAVAWHPQLWLAASASLVSLASISLSWLVIGRGMAPVGMVPAARSDRGTAVFELLLGVPLLLLPIAVGLMTVPQWPERVGLARASAREAASLYATAPSEETGRAAATQAVAAAASNWGVDPSAVTTTFGGSWCRACTVRVEVHIPVPALQIPFAGTVGGFTYTAEAVQRIDDHRSIG